MERCQTRHSEKKWQNKTGHQKSEVSEQRKRWKTVKQISFTKSIIWINEKQKKLSKIKKWKVKKKIKVSNIFRR